MCLSLLSRILTQQKKSDFFFSSLQFLCVFVGLVSFYFVCIFVSLVPSSCNKGHEYCGFFKRKATNFIFDFSTNNHSDRKKALSAVAYATCIISPSLKSRVLSGYHLCLSRSLLSRIASHRVSYTYPSQTIHNSLAWSFI